MNSKEMFARIGKAIYHIDGFYDEFAKRSKVKANLLWILYALNDGKPHSQKEICLDWSLHRSTVNTIIKELEQDGTVELVQVKGEKRELYVFLTKRGHDFADNVLSELYQYESEVFEKVKDKAARFVADLEEFAMILNKKEN